jgi:hypothetical protein
MNRADMTRAYELLPFDGLVSAKVYQTIAP